MNNYYIKVIPKKYTLPGPVIWQYNDKEGWKLIKFYISNILFDNQEYEKHEPEYNGWLTDEFYFNIITLEELFLECL